MPCPHCFATDHTAASCPMFVAVVAAVASQSRDPPAERLIALWAAIPAGTLTPPVAAFLQELLAQLADLRQDLENIRAAMDMEGI